jgi:hypothetical protein
MVINKTRRTYYLPGMISLVCMPLLLYFFFYSYQRESNQTALQLFVWDPVLNTKYPELFTKLQPPRRNYIDIGLTGDNNADKVKLDFAQVRLREITTQQDSINGIHFSFGDSAQYWTFVKAVDMCYAEKVKNFIPSGNNLWALYIPPEPVSEDMSETFICGTHYFTFETHSTGWAAVKEKIELWWQSSWALISGFSVLLLVSILRMIKTKPV